MWAGIHDNTELIGLFCDEFSLEFCPKRKDSFTLEPHFTNWYFGKIFNNFETIFVKNSVEDIENVKMSHFYDINEDHSEFIVVGIASSVFGENKS